MALASLGLLVFFHFLLLREFHLSKKHYAQKLKQLEKLALGEISKSRKLHSEIDHLQQLKVDTDEKLGLIRVLLELMGKGKKGP